MHITVDCGPYQGGREGAEKIITQLSEEVGIVTEKPRFTGFGVVVATVTTKPTEEQRLKVKQFLNKKYDEGRCRYASWRLS